MKLIILDSETTGVDEKDRIIQLAFVMHDGKTAKLHSTYCNPDVPIGFEAMAVHHITPEKIEGKKELKDTVTYKALLELNIPENVLVIHNAKFDLDMLAKEGFENKMQVIDTLNIAKHLWPQLDRHSLQYLRYRGSLYRKEPEFTKKTGIDLTNAHDASADVIYLLILLEEKNE